MSGKVVHLPRDEEAIAKERESWWKMTPHTQQYKSRSRLMSIPEDNWDYDRVPAYEGEGDPWSAAIDEALIAHAHDLDLLREELHAGGKLDEYGRPVSSI